MVGFLKVIDVYYFNWYLDFEVFFILLFLFYKIYVIFFYEVGYKEFENIFYIFLGEGQLKGYDNKLIVCWVLMYEIVGNKEKFWFSKKIKEVFKFEQEVNGKMYWYKIKFGFSD